MNEPSEAYLYKDRSFLGKLILKKEDRYQRPEPLKQLLDKEGYSDFEIALVSVP